MPCASVFNDPGTLEVWIWAGQSNTGQKGHTGTLTGSDVVLANPLSGTLMSNRFFTSEADPTPDDRILTNIQPNGGALGMEMSFARTKILAGHRTCIIKYIVEGSGATWWVSNNTPSLAISWVNSQLALLNEPYIIKGIMWDQGEAETNLTTSTYSANLNTIITAFWTEFGNLPVVMIGQPANVSGQTAQVTADTQAARVSWAASVAGTRTVTIINTTAFPYENNPHWDAPSICRIGELIAAASP